MLIINSPTVLGTIFVNDAKVFPIEVKNVSHIDAKITEIFVGCQSCTTVSMPKRTLHPNESVFMQVTFTPTTLGTHNKTITLSYRTAELDGKVIANYTAEVVA